MYKFSQRSLNNLKNVDSRLVDICNELIKRIDFTVIEGFRTLERQQELYNKVLAKLMVLIKKVNIITAQALLLILSHMRKDITLLMEVRKVKLCLKLLLKNLKKLLKKRV